LRRLLQRVFGIKKKEVMGGIKKLNKSEFPISPCVMHSVF
jgi:hypothetical protein